jgi:hypothetical protein
MLILPEADRPMAKISVYAANVRAGPGSNYPPIASVAQETRCLVLGRAVQPGWYYLQCPSATGWVRAGLYTVDGLLDQLPALAPATPTPNPAAPPPPLWQINGFANRSLASDPAVQFGADTIDFSWGLGAPVEGLPVDEFSLRLEGTLPFAAGTYSIAVTYDDGVRLFVNNEAVIDDWNEGAARTQSWAGPLAGDVPLRIEFFEAYSDATLQLVIMPMPSQAAPPTPRPATLRLPTPPVDAGWLAAYYVGGSPGVSGAAPALAQVEALDQVWPLDRDSGLESPVPGVLEPGNWSVRWRGRFDFDAGDYRFLASTSHGVRLYIDGVRVINGWPVEGAEASAASAEISTVVRDIAAGRHEVIVEFSAGEGPAWVRAGWEILPSP